MKIAMISSGFLPVVDGVTVSLYQRVHALSQLGHQVLLLCPDYQALASIYPNWQRFQGELLPGITVVNLPSEPFMGIQFERNLSRQALPRLTQALTDFAPELIHVDEPDRLFLGLLKAVGVDYAQTHGIPCVGFYHTNFIDYIDDFLPFPAVVIGLIQQVAMQVMRPVFHAYDAILVSNPITETRVKALGLRNTICDRFLGIDITRFQTQFRHADFFQSQYGITDLQDKIKLVFLGRLTPDKGWQFTLKALAAWAKHPDSAPWINRIALIIAGDGALRDSIQAGLNALGFSVYMLGRLQPEAVPPLLINSDIHVTTSEKETLGLTVLEAFAAGIPVLAPNAGGVTSLIRDHQNGVLFCPQGVTSFGQSLFELVSDGQQRQRMGEQGQQDAITYRSEIAMTNLLNTWATLIAQHDSA